MITTNDASLAARMRCMSLHGISRDAWKRYTAEGSWYYEVVAAGFKYNLTDIAAALGLAQLERCDGMRARRAEIAAEYTRRFAPLDCLTLPAPGDARTGHAWHLYPLRLRLEKLAIDRAEFIEQLRALGIGASVHFIPLHLHPHYRDRFGYQPADLPMASAIYPQLVSLPLYSALTDVEVERVVDAVLHLCKTHRVSGERTLLAV
jgi:perosamine synthetase